MMQENSDKNIIINDLCLSFGKPPQQTQVIDHINLEISHDENIAIVGPSGSGKTSLLMLLAGLEQATSGKISLFGHDITAMSEDELTIFRRHIGIIFQDFHLLGAMSALENVALPLQLNQDANAFEKAKDMLARVGLDHRTHHYPGQLSGGEQQRVALARALAITPRLILADEPTGNLDQDTGNKIIDLMFSLSQDENCQIILITHDMQLADQCDRKVKITNGKIIA